MKLIVMNGKDIDTNFRVSKMCAGNACEFSSNFDLAEFDIKSKAEQGHAEYYVFVNSKIPCEVVRKELERRIGRGA